MIDPAPPETPLPPPAARPAGREAGRGTKIFGEAGRERSGEPKFLEKRGGGGAGSQNFWKSGAGFQNKLRIGAGAGRGLIFSTNVIHAQNTNCSVDTRYNNLCILYSRSSFFDLYLPMCLMYRVQHPYLGVSPCTNNNNNIYLAHINVHIVDQIFI